MNYTPIGQLLSFISHFIIGAAVVTGGMAVMKLLRALNEDGLLPVILQSMVILALLLFYTKREIISRHSFFR